MLEMLQAVEPPVLYAIIGVISLAITSLFGLILFASREETFEDVVAKQRKAQEALLTSLQGGSGKSGKQNRKWNKLKNKKASKVKEQEENEIDSGVDDDEPTPESVSVITPPPVIAVEEPPPPPAASKKKKKGKKNKGQQQQQVPVSVVEVEETPVEVIDEDVPVLEETPVEEEHVQVDEEVCVESTADDVEATPEVPSEDEAVEAADDEISAEEADDVPINEEVVEAVEASVEEAEPKTNIVTEIEEAAAPIDEPEAEPEPEPVVVETASKPRKKKSNKSQQKGVITNTVDKLSSELDNSHLSAEEVQQIMDILLKKQNEFEQWQKPNQKSDPIEILKKRIAEAEMQFAEERQSSQAIGMKNKELRLELQQERNARQSIQNEATNRLTQQAKEAETMRKRMEEKHLSEMHSAQSQIARMKEENGMLTNASIMAQQLAEDKQSLVADLTNYQQQNKQLRQELDNVILHNQQELNNLHKAKVDSENALSQRLHEMSEQLMKVEAQNRSMQQVAEQCKVELESQQQAAAPSDELNAKLLQAETKFNDSESLVKVLHEQLEVKTRELEETRALLCETQTKLAELESTLAAEPEDEPEPVPEPEGEVEGAAEVEAEAETENEAETETETEDAVETEENAVEPVNDEVAKLVATVEEKNQMILVLEQKVAALESHSNQSSGQHSPDMVVVTSSDLLGSEPIMTSESFEEVSADKDYQEETDSTQEIAVEVAAEEPVETTSEESLLVEAPVAECTGNTVEALEKEIEELRTVGKSLRETIAKLETEQSTTAAELKEAHSSLAEKLIIIAGKDDTINEKETEIAQKMDSILKAEESLQEAERLLAESNATIVAKDDIIAEKDAILNANGETIREKESVIADNMVNIYDLRSALDEKTTTNDDASNASTDLNKLMLEKDEEIKELKEKAAKLEEETSKLKSDAVVASDTASDTALAEKLKEVEEELKARNETAADLTAKNNELREKNWKVIDALGQAESSTTEKIKAIEISICKGLKNLFPDVSIPKCDNDFDRLFKEFSDNVTESNANKDVSDDELNKTKEINEKLMEEIQELKKTNELMQASQDEIEKSQEENAHLKNVLTETESMLSRLQTGVDAEVQKWQKKVNEKDAELEESKKCHHELKQILSKHGYEHENLETLETNLSCGQKQLMAEKEENSRIKKELEELEKNLADAREQVTKEKQVQEQSKPNNESELAELNSKLKKTISERDLLIREYKSIKDSNTKMEAELKETKESLAKNLLNSDGLKKEIERLKAQTGSTNTEQLINEKDAEIANLNTQINELKEELREERDCVIVDIDPDNAENLHKQVENLSTELESEKQCKANLASKLQDIEKSYQEECSDSDKILDLESKLKSAEQRIKELELEKSKLSPKTRQEAGELSYGTSV